MKVGLQALHEVFNRPIYGEHNPLRLGWSDEQLCPVVSLLSHKMPEKLTKKYNFAVASCALSLVVEERLTGQPVRFARAKGAYGGPKRYRSHQGPYFSWYLVTKAMDCLAESGLIEQYLGVWCPREHGRQSVAWATGELVELLEPLMTMDFQRGLRNIETIVLRDRDEKKDVDYSDTVSTEEMRAQMEIINGALSEHQLLRRGELFGIPPARRIFNGDFDRGGRLYCHGESFQNIMKWERQGLQLLVDGAPHPLVEIDYSNLHAVIAYAEAGQSVPDGDHYAVEGFDRDLVKLAFNTVLNAPTCSKGISAVSEELHHNPDLRWASGIKVNYRRECRPHAENVVAAIQAKHRRISSYFGSDCGARFQRLDSDIAVEILLRMIEKTGRCPLPMHDSFLVADIDRDSLAETMIAVAQERGLPLSLKSSDGQEWSPRRRYLPFRPFHMGGKNSHLGKQNRYRRMQGPDGSMPSKVFRGSFARLTGVYGRAFQRGPPVARY